MNFSEKAQVLTRSTPDKDHWGWTGGFKAIDRLGVPQIRYNDGPQGFRTMDYNNVTGTSTAFPSLLSLSMSWDRDLVYAQGAAMGKEFFDKGAHVMLGPGMNVQRVQENGRAFEYISGEDPVLGRELVPHMVKGIQDQKVLANAKHFVDNSQEDHRTTVSENVDERTNFEMYYPPFQAAIDANVGSFMCSYNKVNGDWSCENGEIIGTHLRAYMGFKGYVMSDWQATHSVALDKGLD